MDIKSELLNSGQKFRKELLTVPVANLQKELSYMTLRVGVRGKETVSELEAEAELKPYQTAKGATDTGVITPRTLETYLGDVVKEVDPYLVYSTVYGEAVAQKRTELEVVKAVAIRIAQNATAKLAMALFNGVRNATGTTTKDLFDGFSTIAAAEETAGNLASAKGNLADIGAITENDVCDKLMEFYQDAASEELQDVETKLFLPRKLYNLYNRGYKVDFGAVPYNNEYKKTYLEGTGNMCELVPLVGMKDEEKIFLTTPSNMLIGVDQISDAEQAIIRECDNPKVVQFFMCAYFGVQFESIAKQRLCVGKFTI